MDRLFKKKMSYNVSSINTISERIEKEDQDIMDNGEKKSVFGCRHICTLLGFIVYLTQNAQRLCLSVAIVAMVNHTSNDNVTLQSVSKGDFNWSSELQGTILGVGFLGMILTQPPGGRLAERFGAKITIAGGSFVSAVCTVLTPLASWNHAYFTLAIQLCRGMAHGVVTPAVYVIMARWFPVNERGFLSTITLAGNSVGGFLGGLLAGWMSDVPFLSWPAAFYFTGAMGFLVTFLFAFFYYERPDEHPRISREELIYICQNQNSSKKKLSPPWRRIFTSVPIYALLIGLFGHYWAYGYFLLVLPTYLGTVLQFNMTENGLISSFPFFLKVFGGLISSCISDWLSRNNYVSVDRLRKGCNFLGCLGFTVCLFGVYLARYNNTVNITCFALSSLAMGLSIPGCMIACTDMTPNFSGSVIGILSAVSSIAFFILPIISGYLTVNQTLEEWHVVFLISGIIVMGSGIVFSTLGSAKVQPWNDDVQPHNEAVRRG